MLQRSRYSKVYFLVLYVEIIKHMLASDKILTTVVVNND